MQFNNMQFTIKINQWIFLKFNVTINLSKK
jgi:hypothetical protein